MDWSKLILVSLASCSFCLSSPSAEAEAGYGYRSYGYGGLGRSYKYGSHRATYTNGISHKGYTTRQYGYKVLGGIKGQGVELERGPVLGGRPVMLASVTRDFVMKTTRPSQPIRVKKIDRLVKPSKLKEAMTPKKIITVKKMSPQVRPLPARQIINSDQPNKETNKIIKPEKVLVNARPPFPRRLPVKATTTTPPSSTSPPPSPPPSSPPPPPSAPSHMFPQPIPAVPGRPVISESASMTSKSNFELRPVPAVPGLLSFSEQPV